MKLLHVFTVRLSVLAIVVLGLWSVLFYYGIIAEIHDETDDALEDYAETIMIRALSGEELSSLSAGTNNQYFMHPVTAEYAQKHLHVYYEDRNVYIKEKKEYEPARVLTHIFQMDDGSWMSLEVSTPTIEKKDLIEAIFLWMAILYGVLIVCVVLTNYLGTHQNMRPLYKLLKWVNSYTPGKKNEPLNNPTKIKEFQQLNEVISNAIKRSEDLHAQQKQFIGNASHEIQTPLAVCIGRLEILMNDEGLTEQQMMEVIKIRRTLDNLSKMNRSLLLLSKIEGGQFAKKVNVDFEAILKNSVPDYDMVFGHQNIKTTLTCEQPFCHDMDESLATTLINNLLKNAYIHNVENGEVQIRLSQYGMRIENTGAAEPLRETEIYNRFYHTPGKKTSTGLGLPIVQAICALYDLNIKYLFENNRHCFVISK